MCCHQGSVLVCLEVEKRQRTWNEGAMADIPHDEKAKKPAGTSALLGFLIGVISHEIFYQFANSYLWFSLVGAIPGLYILRALIKNRLRAMHVIESDDLTIARKLQGRVSYSESFANYCRLAFIACFLIITVGANVLVQEFPEAPVSMFTLGELWNFFSLE